MKVHPIVVHSNGIVSVSMQASFIGDTTDAGDQQRITAYGDPTVDLAGLFTDPNDTVFQFTFPISDLYVGITTAMQNYTARFMQQLPVQAPAGRPWNPFAVQNPFSPCVPGYQAGQLDCVVSDPVHAATVWAAAIDTRVQAAMVILRAKTPAQLTSLPDTTV